LESDRPAVIDAPVVIPGVSLAFDNVAVRAAGHTLVRDVTFDIRPGDHVAIVGPSGAGKSTLVGLLLGWHRPAVGKVKVDGKLLAEGDLPALRRTTAWVDPAVQLWNRPLLDNLRYGLGPDASPDLAEVIDQAQLLSVLELLPDGLQSSLGEGGGLVSGGEGQRVRLARAMLREGTRLAILDEPFRGLDRRQRAELLRRSRRLWEGSTLFVVTHDVSETREFSRVLVLDSGRLVEDGKPTELAERPGSRYGAMLEAEQAVRRGLWSSDVWRRLRIDGGWLLEAKGEGGR
jgi:ATP-binding cassette subfamily B protein